MVKAIGSTTKSGGGGHSAYKYWFQGSIYGIREPNPEELKREATLINEKSQHQQQNLHLDLQGSQPSAKIKEKYMEPIPGHKQRATSGPKRVPGPSDLHAVRR